MSTYLEAPVETERRPLSIAITVARLALIGVALVVVAGVFAYLGGWLTPNNLTPARFTDAFERVDGVHAGFRRNHAKGVGVSGFFESNGNGVRFSKAVVFHPGRVPVVGRFSLSGSQPDVADSADAAVRGGEHRFVSPGQELSVRCTDREDSPAAVAMAVDPRHRATRRSHSRRHHRVASGTGTSRCGNPDARSDGRRRHQRRDRYQLRPLGAARGHRALGRSAAECAFGGVLTVVYQA